MSEAQIKIKTRSKAIDLSRLGVDSTWKHEEIGKTKQLQIPDGDKMTLYDIPGYDSYKKYLIAQALLDNISNSEMGLSIRWAMPYDFVDDNNNPHTDWNIANGLWERRKQRDCMLIWGFGRGYNSTGLVTSVQVKRANVKTIETVGISQIEKGKVAVLEVPCIFKKLDHLRIGITPAETKKDEIVIFGFICEYLGARQTG